MNPTKFIAVTPTISTGGYTVGDAMGGRLEFAGAAQDGFGGVVCSVNIVDLAKQTAEIDLVLFSGAFTATADDAAFDPSDADLTNYFISVITIEATDWKQFNDNSVATKFVTAPFRLDNGTTLYGQLVDRTGVTKASTSDITVKLGTLPD